jgi:hypothetical protein
MILPNPGGKVGHRRTQHKNPVPPNNHWGARAFKKEYLTRVLLF